MNNWVEYRDEEPPSYMDLPAYNHFPNSEVAVNNNLQPPQYHQLHEDPMMFNQNSPLMGAQPARDVFIEEVETARGRPTLEVEHNSLSSCGCEVEEMEQFAMPTESERSREFPVRSASEYKELMRQAFKLKEQMDSMGNGPASSDDLLAFLRLHHQKELPEHEISGLDVEALMTSSRNGGGGATRTSRGNNQVALSSPSLASPLSVLESFSPAPLTTDMSSSSRKRRNAAPDGVLTGPCAVCEADLAAFHFGAISCAACSAFFRRTIAERRTYNCTKTGDDYMNCPIDKRHRCFCRACRLQKCLAQGMDPSAVQPHRDSIGQKALGKRSSAEGAESPPLAPATAKKGRDLIGGEEERERPASGTALVEEAGTSAGGRSMEEALAEHLKGQKRQAQSRSLAAAPMEGCSSPTNPVLSSNHNIVEQLLAFSRTPVIAMASKQGEVITANSLLSQASSSDGLLVPKEEPMDHLELPPQPSPHISSSSSASIPRCPSNYDRNARDCSSSSTHSSRQNKIEIMVEQYQKMLERRRLMFCPSTIRDILSGTTPVARPAKFLHRVRRDNMEVRVEISLWIEFLNSIHPFPDLSVDDKVALVKRLSVSFSVLEKYYSTMRAGGLQMNRIIHSDGTYTDLNDPDSIEFEPKPAIGEKMDRETFKKLFINPLRESLLEISGPMYHSGMSDVEFCALVAILLFDPSTPGLAPSTRSIVLRARNSVCQDWFSFYAERDVEDAAQRVGNTLLLLPAVQTTVEKTAENFHLIRVFDLFEYDKILDEMFSNGSK